MFPASFCSPRSNLSTLSEFEGGAGAGSVHQPSTSQDYCNHQQQPSATSTQSHLYQAQCSSYYGGQQQLYTSTHVASTAQSSDFPTSSEQSPTHASVSGYAPTPYAQYALQCYRLQQRNQHPLPPITDRNSASNVAVPTYHHQSSSGWRYQTPYSGKLTIVSLNNLKSRNLS